jgi:hypothetical protein
MKKQMTETYSDASSGIRIPFDMEEISITNGDLAVSPAKSEGRLSTPADWKGELVAVEEVALPTFFFSCTFLGHFVSLLGVVHPGEGDTPLLVVLFSLLRNNSINNSGLPS